MPSKASPVSGSGGGAALLDLSTPEAAGACLDCLARRICESGLELVVAYISLAGAVHDFTAFDFIVCTSASVTRHDCFDFADVV